ncbi:MAG: acetyl-CoA carboxylase biotin carboxyl carrier protein [Microcella pacifica]|uniref:acetyl-CoA carboxylase biotin carboxyl carrier protein n=1 Tax=Microcella pacifica TaxID=2591847 RepID=UPI003314FD25
MPLNPPDIKELKAIVDWVNLTDDVRELTLKYGDVELHISRDRNGARGTGPVTSVAVPAAAPVVGATEPAAAPLAGAAPAAAVPEAAPVEPTPPSAPAALAPDEVVVTAPMVGIFYEAPKPGAPAFVEVGSRVEPGQVLCIVEVMKLMNNIEAPEVGTITKILVENNQPVAYGQPLMVIKRDA